MTKLNLAELDRLERVATEGEWAVRDHNEHGDYYIGPVDDYVAIIVSSPIPLPTEANAALITTTRNQLRPLLDLVDRLGEALADMGVKNTVSEEDFNRAFAVLLDYQRAKENTSECEKCTGTGARHVAGEPVISEACGECSGEGVV